MARDWQDVFIVDGDVPAQSAGTPAPGDDERRGFFRRLRENLGKTREALASEVQATLLAGPVDAEGWERLEEALIYADVGARTTADVVERLERDAEAEGLQGDALTGRLVELLAAEARPREGDETRIDLRHRPTVVLTVGVNGTGKTTSIGKLAWHLRHTLGRSVLIGAGDTFRAAAVEQLEEWARRADCDVVRGAENADPGAVAYDAVK